MSAHTTGGEQAMSNEAAEAVAELRARRAELSARMRRLQAQEGPNPQRTSRVELRKRLGY